jgi:integrase/recombinase XerD
VSVDTELDDYLRWLTIEKGRQPATVSAYRRDLHRFLTWCAASRVDPRSMSREEATSYLAALRTDGLAPTSVTRHWSSLRGWSRYMVAEGVLESDPTARISAGRHARSLPKPLPESDVIAILDAIRGPGPLDLRDRALLEMLYGTGARVSEALGVQLQHIDFDERLISVVGKGSKQRLVPMGTDLRDALRAYLAPGGRSSLVSSASKSVLFVNHFGGPLTRQGVALLIRRRALAAGVPSTKVSAHVFRHSCATHMLEHGADIRIVQELLGHASIATTQVYTAVSVGSLQAAYADAHPRAHD